MSDKIQFSHFRDLEPYKVGFKEGYTQGQQDLITNLLDMFLNSDAASSYNIDKFKIELTKIKKNKKDINTDQTYTKSSWV